MPITGMKVSTVMTPSNTPSTSSECTQPSAADGPNSANSQSMPSVHHSLTVTSNQSCIGPASVVVAWNTVYITARNATMPNTGCSSTRSTRSDQVGLSVACRSSSRSMRAVQSNRASARDSDHARASTTSSDGSCNPSGSGVPENPFRMESASCSFPSPVRPSTETTGMPPSRFESRSGAIRHPRRAARSFIVRTTTVGRPSSATMDSRYSERDMAVASSTTTARSGTGMPSAPVNASMATCSSGLIGDSE